MHLTYLGHACQLVETAGRRVLVDPGGFSSDWHDLTDLDAVLVTHEHGDHLDPEHVAALMTANPGAVLYAEPSVAQRLSAGELDGPAVAATALPAGETADLGGGLVVEGVGGTHATIHVDIPLVGNVGMLLRAEGEPTLFHPGDSYAAVPSGVDVLGVPVHAPWAALKEAIDFARAVGASSTVPIHDFLLTPPARAMYVGRIEAMGGATFVDLADVGRTSF